MSEESPILKNAISAIKVALDDFHSRDEQRLLSSVRNITSGLLLLYKQHLSILSPTSILTRGGHTVPLYIASKIELAFDENKQPLYKAGSKKTVDVTQIITRLNGLGYKLDVKALNNLTSIRNDIEHHYPKNNEVSMVIGEAVFLIFDCFTNMLSQDPRQLMGDQYWKKMNEIEKKFKKTESRCKKTFEPLCREFDIHISIAASIECIECGLSKLLQVDIKNIVNGELGITPLTCMRCSHTSSFKETAISYWRSLEYFSIKNGGDYLIGQCNSCDEETYIIELDLCVNCGEVHMLEHESCCICGDKLTMDDQEYNGLCSYHNYVAEKEMFK